MSQHHQTSSVKVVLAGPPRSGKSCLRQGLKDSMRNLPGAPYPYVITACPDGEGSWFQEAVNSNAELAARCKAAYKSRFTPEFVRRVSDNVKGCCLPLTLIDIGGIPSAENEEICSSATHIILLLGDMSKLGEWLEFCRKVGLKLIAVIRSDYHGSEDTIPVKGTDGIFRGSVHHLERGEQLAERPTIKALARIIAAMAADNPHTFL